MYANVRIAQQQLTILGARRNSRYRNKLNEDTIMLYTIAIILLILWVLGLVTSYTVGGFIHILLVVAVIMILVRLISGRGI
jgi:fatty-acid desaturase